MQEITMQESFFRYIFEPKLSIKYDLLPYYNTNLTYGGSIGELYSGHFKLSLSTLSLMIKSEYQNEQLWRHPTSPSCAICAYVV